MTEKHGDAQRSEVARYALAPTIQAHYGLGVERDRLTTWGWLEALRTREMLHRFLPPAPAVIIDVGGAEGAYALPLAVGGYRVHLIDPWAPHVRVARAASARQPDAPLMSVQEGDARDLPYDDGVADGLLLLGPLYHLIDPRDRARALCEAHRVLRPGGVLMAAGISRFASTISGIASDAIGDPGFEAIVERDLRDGVHDNPDPVGRPEWFTLAYFHEPDELRAEIAGAGFDDVEILAIEGVAAMQAGEPPADQAAQDALQRAIRRVESEPSLLGATAHMMAIGHVPAA
ncbi:class I SAM-dependent methyltransferase [Mycobacterium sp. NPDC003449]